jgi:hypothetical protein
MPHASILLTEEAGINWFVEHGADVFRDTKPDNPKCTLRAVVLVRGGMESGQPSVMLAAEVDGRTRVFETSLQLLETACAAMRAASGVERAP